MCGVSGGQGRRGREERRAQGKGVWCREKLSLSEHELVAWRCKTEPRGMYASTFPSKHVATASPDAHPRATLGAEANRLSVAAESDRLRRSGTCGFDVVFVLPARPTDWRARQPALFYTPGPDTGKRL